MDKSLEFWKPIIYKDGKLDEEQVLKELSDFYNMIQEVPLVFERVTGGMISKPNTKAFEVINIFEDFYYSKGITQDDVMDMIKRSKTPEELKEELAEYFELSNPQASLDKEQE